MYNFIFWFFYKFFEWRDKYKSPFLSSAMVGLVIVIHLSVIYSVIRYLSGYTVGMPSDKYAYNKLILLPFVILLFFFIYKFYYKKREQEILTRFGDRNAFSVRNILIVVFVIVVPLMIAIRLTNLSVSHALSK